MATKLMQRLNKNCVNISWFANNRTIGTNGRTLGITICRPSNTAEGLNRTAILFGSVKSYFSYPQICGCTAKGNTVHRGRDHRAQQGRAYSTSAESSTKLIYSGPLTSVVRGVKFFSLSTTIMSGTLVPLLLRFGDSGVMTTIGLSFATVMIATPILLHWFSRSYVTRLYLDGRGDGYVAKTMTFILREKTHKFKATDVAIPSIRNVFTTFVANGRPFLVDPRGFFDPNQFSQLMGQDEISQDELEKMMKNMKDDED